MNRLSKKLTLTGKLALGGALLVGLAQLGVKASPGGKSIAINFGADQPSMAADEDGSSVDGAAGLLGTENWNNPEGANSVEPVPVDADESGARVEGVATVSWASNNLWSSTGLGEENNTAPEGENRDLMSGYLDTNATDTIFVEVEGVPYDVYEVHVYMKGGVIGRSGNYAINCLTQFHVDAAAFSGDFIVGEDGDVLIFENVTGSTLRVEATPVNTRGPINGIEIVETPGAVLDTEPPSAPTNLAADEIGALRVLLSWGAATDNSGNVTYEVMQNGESVATGVTGTTYEARNLNAETEYTFQVQAWDAGCNSSDPTAELAVTTAALELAEGFVIAKIFETGGGATIDDLLTGYDHADFPDNPAQSIPQAGAQLFPGGVADNYTGLIQFELVIEEAGQYDFFIRSDDASEMYLNEDGPDFPEPGVGFPIIWEEQCCQAFFEPDVAETETTANPISLTPGSYGVSIAWSEGGGGDFVQVAMRNVNDTTPAANLNPIGGSNLRAPFDTVGSTVAITSQPTGGEFSENEKVTLSVGFDFASPYVPSADIQWFKNDVAVGGGKSASLTFPRVKKSDAGDYRVELRVPGTAVVSEQVAVTVTDDLKAPDVSVGNLMKDGKHEIGIGFSEPVDVASLSAAEVTVSGGTIDSTAVVTRPLDGWDIESLPAADQPFEWGDIKVTVSGLTVGESYTVSVKGAKDVAGNEIDPAVERTITAADDSWSWGVVGDATLGFEDNVAVIGDGDFDILASGTNFWSDNEEATFAYQEIEGDFDKKARVESHDPGSQWSRGGILMREGLDFGKPPVPRDEWPDCEAAFTQDPDTLEFMECIPADVRFSRIATVHVNPNSFWNSPGGGNSAYENHVRSYETMSLADRNELQTVGVGGNPVPYPNAWMRMKREGNDIITFRSDDGVNWSENVRRTYIELASTLFVGPFLGPELGNNGAGDGLGHSVLIQIREYGDVGGGGGPGGDAAITGFSVADGSLTVEWTGSSLELRSTITGAGTEIATGGGTTVVPLDGTEGYVIAK